MQKYLLLALSIAALPMHAMQRTKYEKTISVGVNQMEHFPLSASYTVNFMDVCDDNVVTLFMAKDKKQDIVNCALSVQHPAYAKEKVVSRWMKSDLQKLEMEPEVTILSTPKSSLTTTNGLLDYMQAENAICENFKGVTKAPYDITKITCAYLRNLGGSVTAVINYENAIEVAAKIRPRGYISVRRQGEDVTVNITGHDPLQYTVAGALIAKASK